MKNKLTLLWLIFLIACVPSCSTVEQRNTVAFQEAKQSYASQNYNKAFGSLATPAKRGNANAQYALGYMYFYGKGVFEDRQKALYWFKLAAEQGHPSAQEALAMIDHQELMRQEKSYA